MKKRNSLVWGKVKNALARQIHRLPAYIHLLIVTAHVRQAFNDSEPTPQPKVAKFYDAVWQTLDPVGYLVKLEGQAAPKAIFRPPYDKSRLPAMSEELPSFGWEEEFKRAVIELQLPSPAESGQRIEGFLGGFREFVREIK